VHAAGNANPPPLSPGHCWEIMTGACLPADCDTIVPYEETARPDPERVSCPASSVHPGRFVHRAGSDFAAGAVLVPAAARLDSRVASVAATIGATRVAVLRRPRLAIFTTGDEVVPPGQSPLPHQVRQSNAASLRAALHHLDTEVVQHLHLPDDEDRTRRAVADCPDVDGILLCGGISKGKYDYVRPVIESLHGPPAFHGIAQRPGKPLAFWPGPPAIFALPGNPMSVLVCFHRYVRPFLDAMRRQSAPIRHVALAAPIRFDAPVTYFLPVQLRQDGARLLAAPHPLANSGDFASSIESDGFIELPAAQSDFPEGFLAPFRDWL
jgi:molybdopterin molybdotransferase